MGSLNPVNVIPEEGAHHSDKEMPFVWHKPTNTLFYTTQYCHHHHIMDKIHSYLSDYLGDGWGNPDDLISGDITEPAHGHNWIKFINGRQFDPDVIQFLQGEFGPDRKVVWNDGNGYQPITPDQIQKEAASNPNAIKEWRWSYDPDLDQIQVWETDENGPTHMEQTGMHGLYTNAQGRIYLLPDHVDVFYWKDRPLGLSGDSKQEIQEKGWKLAWEWVQQNHIAEMVPQNMTAKVAGIEDQVQWQYAWAYSAKFILANNKVLYAMEGYDHLLDPKIQQYGLTPKQYTQGEFGIWNGNYVYRLNPLTKPATKVALESVKKTFASGYNIKLYNYDELKEYEDKGEMHPAFLPVHGCFGFLNGHLIIGMRHHQEIMYRLLESGWTWDDLLKADQRWGWFSYSPGEGVGDLRFSSDAGTMTADISAVEAAFENLYHAPFHDNKSGYGGKSESTYGGNFNLKYGPTDAPVEEMTGTKTKYDNSILTPLPAPPVEDTDTESPEVTHAPGPGFPPPHASSVWETSARTATPKVKTSAIYDVEGVLGGPGYYHACFGWINGDLYLGETHHAFIISKLIEDGTYTFETLMAAKQMWGWFEINEDYDNFLVAHDSEKYYADVWFATDDAAQSYGVKQLVKNSFKEAFPFVNKWTFPTGIGHTTQENYGQRAKEQYLGEPHPVDGDSGY